MRCVGDVKAFFFFGGGGGGGRYEAGKNPLPTILTLVAGFSQRSSGGSWPSKSYFVPTLQHLSFYAILCKNTKNIDLAEWIDNCQIC